MKKNNNYTTPTIGSLELSSALSVLAASISTQTESYEEYNFNWSSES